MNANELWAEIETRIRQFEAYIAVMATISIQEDYALWKTLQARKIKIVEERRALSEKWKEAVYAEKLAAVTLPDAQPVTVQSVTPYGDYCAYCYQHHMDCTCDLCALNGHKWSLDYVVDYQIFHSCEVCGLEEAIGVMGVSGHSDPVGEQVVDWRREIVEEAINEDGQNGR